jgi:site-specific DNA-methyltransferase (adenine-specific)/modification methylase
MSLPAPYYQDTAVTIYHGDCREILPHLPPVDLVLTDPPYGQAYNPAGGGRGWSRKSFGSADCVVGDSEPFDPRPLLDLDARLILWGANHYAERLPSSPTWLVWDKRDGRMSDSFADCELAWSNLGGPARLIRHLWCGAFKASERGAVRLHPTQKPLRVMSWTLGLAGEWLVVLDPFMGSGTTLRAAKDLGRKAIGIEICEAYCEIAAKRMAQGVLPL